MARDELGVGSMVCVQLFTHEDRVGALNMFASAPRAFDADDIDIALAVAAHAAVAATTAQEIDNLQSAVAGRTVIGQATGLLMQRFQLSDHGAFELLRRLSMEQNIKLADVARGIVRQHLDDLDR